METSNGGLQSLGSIFLALRDRSCGYFSIDALHSCINRGFGRHHYHNVAGRCMVCAEDRVETFQHLFIECEAATFLWEGLTPLLEAVRFNFADTHQGGRLLGDVS